MQAQEHIRILLVEDEPVVRLVACSSLEDAGFEVLEADNAQGALQILTDRSDVSIVFTDINMPGALDGLGLADLVHRRWPNIKLLVTSGRAPASCAPYCQFLAKPYSLPSMIELIGALAAA